LSKSSVKEASRVKVVINASARLAFGRLGKKETGKS